MLRPELDLATRTGLPDALRALVEAYPKSDWQAHPNFGGMVAFWLERHMMFRKLHEMLIQDAEGFLDAKMASDAYVPRLSRFGGMMLNELHGHHHIEDEHYFPKLQRVETSLGLGFEILDSDHHALDAALGRFADSANAMIRAAAEDAKARDAAGAFRTETIGLGHLLMRHLEDEEEIVVPTILKHGPEAFE